MAIRMTEQVYLVLLALADGPRHGYGVVQRVLELSDGEVRLGAGTLYGVLDRLTTAGWIAESGEEVVDGRLRRYYLVTEDGTTALEAETARLRALTAKARAVLRPGLAGA